jgi:hypothetical protein
MTDDRSLERAARSWLENGPTDAPDRAVEAALHRIQTTRQERDWNVPWRDRSMTSLTRLVAAMIAIAIVAVGGVVLFRPGGQPNVGGPSSAPTIAGSPSPSPMDALAALQAYRAARDAICVPASQQLVTLNAAGDAATSPAEHADVVAQIIVLGTTETDQLAALKPPPALAEEHAADVLRHRDSLALLGQIEGLLRQGKMAEADAVDQALGAALSSQEETFQQRYSLADCP